MYFLSRNQRHRKKKKLLGLEYGDMNCESYWKHFSLPVHLLFLGIHVKPSPLWFNYCTQRWVKFFLMCQNFWRTSQLIWRTDLGLVSRVLGSGSATSWNFFYWYEYSFSVNIFVIFLLNIGCIHFHCCVGGGDKRLLWRTWLCPELATLWALLCVAEGGRDIRLKRERRLMMRWDFIPHVLR